MAGRSYVWAASDSAPRYTRTTRTPGISSKSASLRVHGHVEGARRRRHQRVEDLLAGRSELLDRGAGDVFDISGEAWIEWGVANDALDVGRR